MGEWEKSELQEYREHYAEKRQRELLLLVDLLADPAADGQQIERFQDLFREIIADLRHD